jgi:hypothetical protein
MFTYFASWRLGFFLSGRGVGANLVWGFAGEKKRAHSFVSALHRCVTRQSLEDEVLGTSVPVGRDGL